MVLLIFDYPFEPHFTFLPSIDNVVKMLYFRKNNNKGNEKKSKEWDMLQRAFMVRKSTEYIVENGLGAAYRLQYILV